MNNRFFIELIRIALGNQYLLSSCLSPDEWLETYCLTEQQGLLALTFGAIQRIAERQPMHLECFLPDLKMQWLGMAALAEQQYDEYEQTVKKLSAFARCHGLRLVVLKGYGNSLNYPNPKNRLCGDIDVYVAPIPNSIEKQGDFVVLDRAVQESLGIEVDNHNSHHSTFLFNGFTVENHRTIMDPDTHKEYEELNWLLAGLVVEGVREINGILIPSVQFNSIHLLAHMAGDFASTGTDFRRLLDWSTFVSVHSHEINWDFVFETSSRLGMLPFLNAINEICVTYLGYDITMFPVRSPNPKRVERVLHDLLNKTEPILYPSQTNIIHYSWVKGIRFLQNRWKYKMVYKESVWRSLWHQARNTIRTRNTN